MRLDGDSRFINPESFERSSREIDLQLRPLTRCQSSPLSTWNPVTFATAHCERRHTLEDGVVWGGLSDYDGF